MFSSVVQQLAHHPEHQDRSAHVHHSDMGAQSGTTASTAHSIGDEPNLIPPQSNTHFMSGADGDDEDLMRIENPQLGQTPSSLLPEEYGLQTARVQVQRAAKSEEYMEKFQYCHKTSLQYSKIWFIKSGVIGGVRGTMPCTSRRNCSKMLSRSINGQLRFNSKMQLLLLREVQQRKCKDSF